MNPLRSARYFLREAAADLWGRRTVNLVSIGTIAASLYVLGLFVLIGVNLGRLLGSWAEENRVSVFLSDEISESDRTRLQQRIASDPLVKAWEYVDKASARERFKRDFPDLADLVGGLETNPLPASFEIGLEHAAANSDAVDALAASLRGAPGVDGVRYDLDWVRRVRSLLAILGWGGAILGGILLVAAVITISGVVRLNVLARREEIEILRLVGATRGFIRGPFLVEGAFQGVAASAVAVGALCGTWAFVSSRPVVRADRLLAGLTGEFLPVWAPAGLLALGFAVGLAGALVSVRRTIRSSAA